MQRWITGIVNFDTKDHVILETTQKQLRIECNIVDSVSVWSNLCATCWLQNSNCCLIPLFWADNTPCCRVSDIVHGSHCQMKKSPYWIRHFPCWKYRLLYRKLHHLLHTDIRITNRLNTILQGCYYECVRIWYIRACLSLKQVSLSLFLTTQTSIPCSKLQQKIYGWHELLPCIFFIDHQ